LLTRRKRFLKLGLKRYLIKRAITGALTIVMVVLFNFFLFRLPIFFLGWDPTDIYIGPTMSAETKELIREMWGLPSKNATIQEWLNHFFKYVQNIFTLNFGFSYRTSRPVISLISERIGNTLLLMGISTILSILLGIWAGVKAASRHGEKTDLTLVSVSLFIYSMPIFWLGMVLLLFFGFYLYQLSGGTIYFPIGGKTHSYPVPTDPLGYLIDLIWHLVLPVATLTLSNFGYYLLLMRSNLVDVLSEDYILTARAKGLDERTILFKHAMKNAFLPMITVISLSLATIWTGATLTETVFNWYGIGRLIFEALIQMDFPVSEAIFFLMSFTIVIANIIADILYGIIDPRVKYD